MPKKPSLNSKPITKKKQKSNSKRKDSHTKSKKRTIGPGLITEILDSKKVIINNVEVSKKAFENIAIFASNLKPAMTIEQAISSLLEQGFNPIYNPKKVRLLT
jgi:hypothetical protein